MKDNITGPSEIALHRASKVLGGCSTPLDQLLHPPSYTSTTIHECNVVLAGYVGSVVVPHVLLSAFPVQSFSRFLTGSCDSPPTTYHSPSIKVCIRGTPRDMLICRAKSHLAEPHPCHLRIAFSPQATTFCATLTASRYSSSVTGSLTPGYRASHA